MMNNRGKWAVFFEQGRSLIEMLGTLAVMGVLSIIGLAGYHHLIDKNIANNVLYDARTIHTLMIGEINPVSNGWIDNTTVITTPYTFKKKYDKSLKPFVKVSGVEKSICKKIIQLSSDNLSFLTSDNTPFTTCGDENEIVVNFNGDVKMATCATQTDCSEEGSICSAGQCISCGEHQVPNEDGTECVCDEGYKGELCNGCDNNYVMKEGVCVPCPTGTGTDTETFLGKALTGEYAGCYCQNANEWWHSQEQKCGTLYQELEYLESTGTQYIDTGYYAKPNTKIMADFQLTDSAQFTSTIRPLFGHWGGNYGRFNFGLLTSSLSGTKFAWDISDVNQAITVSTDLLRHTVEVFGGNGVGIDGAYCKIDDVIKYQKEGTAYESSSRTMWVFGGNNQAGKLSAKLYSFKIMEGNALVGYLVPARRNSYNVLGMYDTVTKTFFTNSGTGTFIAGPEVANTHIQE